MDECYADLISLAAYRQRLVMRVDKMIDLTAAYCDALAASGWQDAVKEEAVRRVNRIGDNLAGVLSSLYNGREVLCIDEMERLGKKYVECGEHIAALAAKVNSTFNGY